MDTLEKDELTTSTHVIGRFLKSGIPNYEFTSLIYGWQKHKKKNKTGNCKAFCVSQERNNSSLRVWFSNFNAWFDYENSITYEIHCALFDDIVI